MSNLNEFEQNFAHLIPNNFLKKILNFGDKNYL